ncbi:cellulose synthase-like protein E1 isoform X4 [Gossypium hirsutum]|uniref:Cellulose synthase-like protein E1 isoform X4 n=1 Tax=Gossypium hirsutum TaxID=3635 RepID=A0A1U8MCI8_GOSHI|nr:cellulose synthase-like protein E1 isoform X4 [Gossypium hirsutum]
MAENEYVPLFETRQVKGRILFRYIAASILLGICFIIMYRIRYFPVGGKAERWTWIGLFLSELWFSFYWLLTTVCRWNAVIRIPFIHRLSQRFGKELPGIDIFVCTADPLLEPPSMVVNTVLSMMAYDYPPEKLSVYLSDDGGSNLTFYAMLEAANFSKTWLPFCKKFKVEPMSPEAYFRTASEPLNVQEWPSVKIRISSKISNGPIILNVDCDMYSNNSESIKYSLCVFMDEEKGDEFGYVQFPQSFDNLTKNDIYGCSFRVIQKLEVHGLDANGGPCFIGTGCFHRREALCGKKYEKNFRFDLKKLNNTKVNERASLLEETCKVLASCTFEHNTTWGKEMGLIYGFPAEDIVTGLSVQCRRWKSMFLDPERDGFLGVAPITLLQLLVQHKRWTEGHLQVFLSKYCPLLYGYKKIPLKLRLAYCAYNLWAANCLATLYYVVVPCLCLLKGITLFPKISSPWVLPFAYVAFSHHAYSLGEFLWCGGTFLGWCNDQRMWLFKRTTSYLFASFETILKLLGYSQLAFVITTKVADEDISKRYDQEMIEFGVTSPMFDILATLAILNLLGSFGAIKKVTMHADKGFKVLDQFGLQILLCLVLVTINLPVYQALFFRMDKGKMPSSVTYKSIIFALLACTLAVY